ncbi:short-chain dehydrogenase/reductase SDR [Chitinispirillum alkaliphilum]|nr:short-chain dehydrogenase/reductase SDR [Chitinispirillum alkaliphilum]
MKKAIIIGASSGIGKALAEVFSRNNIVVGLASRRIGLLNQLKKDLPSESYVKAIDITNTGHAMEQLCELIKEMNGVDLIVINAGCGYINPDLDFAKEIATIEVNVSGFTAMLNVALRHMCSQGFGHIVGISSLSALRGGYDAPAYSASKAYVSNYLEAVRIRVKKEKLPITVTDIKPGFVDTAMAQGEGLFWVAAPEKAANQIYRAILKKRKHTYITKRWRLIAWVLKIMPEWIYQKL